MTQKTGFATKVPTPAARFAPPSIMGTGELRLVGCHIVRAWATDGWLTAARCARRYAPLSHLNLFLYRLRYSSSVVLSVVEKTGWQDWGYVWQFLSRQLSRQPQAK